MNEPASQDGDVMSPTVVPPSDSPPTHAPSSDVPSSDALSSDAPVELVALASAVPEPAAPGPGATSLSVHSESVPPIRAERPVSTIDADTRSFLRPEPVERPRGLAERLRFTSVGIRLLMLTLASVALAASIAAVAVWGVVRTGRLTSEVAVLADLRDVNASGAEELRAMSEATDIEVPEVGRRIAALSGRITSAAPDAAIRQLADDALVAARAYEDARSTNQGRVVAGQAFRAADAQFVKLDEALVQRRNDVVANAQQQRSRVIVLMLAILGVGSLVLLAFGRLISRSVVQPLRLLGRSLRRFGDGDLFARASEATDEVGTLARSFNAMASGVSDRVRDLNAVAERGTQLRMISDALDLADRESDVYRILDRAFGILTPDLPAELLLNELTSTRLWPVSANPSAGAAGCPVANTEGCVAMRRGQPVVFESPAAINACPQLRDHATACSAACVPVSVNGHLLGVVHVTAPEHTPPQPEIVEQLVTLAGQVGTRIGAMRTLETSRLEASTDGLTGLANRRMLEARLGDLVRGRLPFALAVADLDRFKHLNDTYGHEIGDRALQVFSKVLHDNVRGHDLVARYGGEEFVLVFPELSVAKSMEVLERIRLALVGAIDINGLPSFSSSFGVTHSSTADSVEGIIRIADAGLLMAKDLGRNRVVFADQELAIEVFGSRGPESGSMPLRISLQPEQVDPDPVPATGDLGSRGPAEDTL